MQTHDDKDQSDFIEKFPKENERAFLKKLEERAADMKEKKLSEITGGKEGEGVLSEWSAHGMHVTVRPDDPQGILRISVGGGPKTPVSVNYCVVRGDLELSVRLLQQAISALKAR